jgi:Zn-dependent metalloprotease
MKKLLFLLVVSSFMFANAQDQVSIFKSDSEKSFLEHKFISKTTFVQMKDTYDKNIKSVLGDAYSNYLLVPVKDLEEYFRVLKIQADKKGTKVADLKIHFAATNDEKGQLTLIFQGTFENNEESNLMLDTYYPCPPVCGPFKI